MSSLSPVLHLSKTFILTIIYRNIRYICSDIFISPETLPDIPLAAPRDVPQLPVVYTGGNTAKDGSHNGGEP